MDRESHEDEHAIGCACDLRPYGFYNFYYYVLHIRLYTN